MTIEGELVEMAPEINNQADPIVGIQISMAKMEGMLTQALADHGQRIQSNDVAISVERNRITEIANTVGQHSITSTNHANDISEIKEKLNNGTARTMMVITGIIAAGGLIISFVNMIQGAA